MARNYGGGGLLNSLIKGILGCVVRETLVQAGLKKPHRGGIKITQSKRIVQDRDKYGHKPNKKKGHRA